MHISRTGDSFAALYAGVIQTAAVGGIHMDRTDRKLLTSMTGVLSGLMMKYFLWDIYMRDSIKLTDSAYLADGGYWLAQTILTVLIVVSAFGVVWFGLVKKD